MNQDNKIITLLTDFGLKDVYVGVIKGVIHQINPEINIIDLTHDILPQNIAAGRFCLMNAYSYFPEKTVHIAVVDPGVGTQRRAIAIQFKNSYLVGPDNGLLTGLLEPFLTSKIDINSNHLESPEIIAIELNNPQYWRTAQPSTTFHGRDIFASVGAHLASGVPLEQLGTPIDPKTLMKLSLPSYRFTDLGIEGSIQYIDGFGNLVTNIPGEAVADKNWYLVISKGQKKPKNKKHKQKKTKKNSKQKLKPKQQKFSSLSCLIPRGQTYGDVALGQLVALVGSHDWVEIALNGGNAQQQLNIDWGAKIQVMIRNQS
ncbi:conserved hypothetical protein [Planktothrix serta PCC 8927]|uniref:SAM-dependent chlorinase/fluorinase n=1 Tax=Planktothrix serta PCC 8927 TaxID=671068 RepID=A0A7Z9E386_9CYAN|nr:SAM-dependent chlorinase/fluorinase [Planktothrix serta]VXD23121.1 conserved hypothetical protein [Planktothrix serta PCC 8927]